MAKDYRYWKELTTDCHPVYGRCTYYREDRVYKLEAKLDELEAQLSVAKTVDKWAEVDNASPS